MHKLIVAFLFSIMALPLCAQSLLGRTISINADQQPLKKVLSVMEEEGGFRFSFQSTILPADSLISIHTGRITLAEGLDRLLNHRYEYRQSGNFIIIRYAPLELKLLIIESKGNAGYYQVSGQIVDKYTEKPIANASIYEKSLLIAEVSDSSGYFSIGIKQATQPLLLTITKTNYKSLNTHFLAEVNISNKQANPTEAYMEGNLAEIEQTWLGRNLITRNQKIQSVNIGNFISRAPVQFSFIPGLNSHGSLSGQVINRFSFNVIGAYSAGVNGAEIGLLFNINKSKAHYFQFGGAFNLVGGEVKGLQVSGLSNLVFDNVKALQVSTGYNYVGKNFEGFQIGGLYNRVKERVKGIQVSVGLNRVGYDFTGLQIGGLYNEIGNDLQGMQISPGLNYSKRSFKGVQIGALNEVKENGRGLQIGLVANITRQDHRGLQMGFINYARRQNGFQLGFINLSGKTKGFSLGLLNIAREGYHKTELGFNPATGITLAYKSGNPQLYNILKIGVHPDATQKQYSGGIGWGKEFLFSPALFLNPEWGVNYIYLGNWSKLNLLQQVELPLALKVNHKIALRSGPSFNLHYSNQNIAQKGYTLLQQKYGRAPHRQTGYFAWLSWNIGIVIQSL